jgi:hypothetical protein
MGSKAHGSLSISFVALMCCSGSTASTAQSPQAPIEPSAGDSCDFTTALTFGFDQVLRCFKSVPFCPDKANPATCDRDAQIAHLRAAIEGFSDLRHTYDATAGWRHQLDVIASKKYRSDFDLYVDMSNLMRSFHNPHWSYYGPACFEESMWALVPLELSSALTKIGGSRRQIVYLREPIPYFSDLYIDATGIDVNAYTGQRVVSLNGEPPLQFLRRWVRTGLARDDDDGSNLMLVFDDWGYTLRGGAYNAFPESQSITLTLEDRAGKRTRLELPWIFLPPGTLFGYPGPPITSSNAEFRAQCFAPAAASATLQKAAPTVHRRRAPIAIDERLAKRRALIESIDTRAATSASAARRATPIDFSEVPPEKRNIDITEILPLADGARTVAYTDDTVAVQIRVDFSADWDDEFAAGASYACEHADRLIVDMRKNMGGYLSRVFSLARYLNATAPAFPDSVLAYRQLAASPALNELRRLSEPLVSLGFDSCTSGYEAACYTTVPGGQVLTDAHWYRRAIPERRGRQIELVTPRVIDSSEIPPADRTIPCPGKFVGKNLIVLVNGINASAAYFAPLMLKTLGTVVVQGGLWNEPMVIGTSRGGPVVHSYYFQQDADFLRDVTGQVVEHRLPDLPRPIDFRIEWQGFYTPDLGRLTADQPAYGDLQVPFWSNRRDTDGAAYRTAVSAVERKANIDPYCSRLVQLRRCDLYDRCARVALEFAVHSGALTRQTARRTFEDAATECRAR